VPSIAKDTEDMLQRKKMRKEVAVEELALKKMRSVYLLMSAESGCESLWEWFHEERKMM